MAGSRVGETLAPLPPSGKKTPAPHAVPMLGTLRTARFLVAPVSVQLSFSSFSPVCPIFAMTEWAHSGIRRKTDREREREGGYVPKVSQ